MKIRIITILSVGLLALVPITMLSASKTSSASKAPEKAKTSATAKPKSSSSRSSAKATVDEPTPEQRQAMEQVSDLTTTQKSKMLVLLNEGDAEQLAAIKGISTTRATAIEKARPFDSIDEVVLVRGIGKRTFTQVIAHARSLTARRSSSSSPASKAKTSKS